MIYLLVTLTALLVYGLRAGPGISDRIVPTGHKMDEGWQSLITFASFPALRIWETSVTPGALEGGDPIDTTTMFSECCTTKAPQRLKSVDDIVVEAQYDARANQTLWEMINVPDSITVRWPDGSAQGQWGYLRRAEFSPLVRGEPPKVTLTVVVTNWDPYNCVEACPEFVEGTGTCTPTTSCTD